MSVRIQQILQNEASLTEVVDPLGGSYYVEALTDDIRQRAWAFFDEIRDQGGFLAVLDSGWLHARALDNQTALLNSIDQGERNVVGVNFAEADVSEFEVNGFQGTSDAWERGMERLTELRRSRESRHHRETMHELERVCGSGENILPPMLDAVAAGATVGEFGDVFRSVFGDWVSPVKF
jgi:methylmalonyl-CoA mutase N-terminal domain/subunit